MPVRGHSGDLWMWLHLMWLQFELILERTGRSFGVSQRDPEVGFLAKWTFGGLGYQGQQTIHFPESIGSLALPPSAARPTKTLVSGKCVVF